MAWTGPAERDGGVSALNQWRGEIARSFWVGIRDVTIVARELCDLARWESQGHGMLYTEGDREDRDG